MDLYAPYFRMISPDPRLLFSVEEQRGWEGQGDDPRTQKNNGRPLPAHVRLHRKYDPEETITRDNHQRQDARHQQQDWNTKSISYNDFITTENLGIR